MTQLCDQLSEQLAPLGQGHLLKFWQQLDPARRTWLAESIQDIDWHQIAVMQQCLHESEARHDEQITPAPVMEFSDAQAREAYKEGVDALTGGRVAVLLVAGGQGSRLGFDGPKGAFPIGPISGASLFEIHARKVLALEQRYRARIPFLIMTSLANDSETRAFFDQHAFFGLDPDRVIFFTQGMLPAMWPDGRVILEAPDKLAMAPDGHGGVIAAMKRAELFDRLQKDGIDTLFYFQVDNPLVNVADPVFIGRHLKQKAQISVKVCAKRSPEEGLGVVAIRDGRTVIVEYTELTDAQKADRQPDGNLTFGYGSVAIHVFTLDFMARQADHDLPLHRAFKKITACDDAGRPTTPNEPNGYKFERFIFDTLPRADRVNIVVFDREMEFSPVKNAQGDDSPEVTRQSLVRAAANLLEAAGIAVPRDPTGHPRHVLEIDPVCATDAETLRARLGNDFRIDGDTHIV